MRNSRKSATTTTKRSLHNHEGQTCRNNSRVTGLARATMEKRSFAWKQNPYSGLLRLSSPVNTLPGIEALWSGMPHRHAGSHELRGGMQIGQSEFYDNSASQPDGLLEAHGTKAGLFSASRETIWLIMTDCIRDRDETASGTYRSCSIEKQVLAYHRMHETSAAGTGRKSFSDLYMGHGS